MKRGNIRQSKGKSGFGIIQLLMSMGEKIKNSTGKLQENYENSNLINNNWLAAGEKSMIINLFFVLAKCV
jgi:hypothetical protein